METERDVQVQPIRLSFVRAEFDISQFDDPAWNFPEPVYTTTYWDGRSAVASRHFATRGLWSSSYLYVRFDAARGEELVLNDFPQTDVKTLGLWDRDVCEIFVEPDRSRPGRYFEFEVAPTGEWLDLAIDFSGDERVIDWDYESGLEAVSLIGDDCIAMAIRIPWGAFGRKPNTGDIWRGNLYRCVGCGPGRGYLAHFPTLSDKPNFHVPDRFGTMIFDD